MNNWREKLLNVLAEWRCLNIDFYSNNPILESMSIKELIQRTDKKNIIFSKHAIDTLEERNLEQSFIVQKLFETDKFEIEAKQNGTYMLIYRHSRKYSIVIIIIPENDMIKIVTAFKSSKKIEKLFKHAKAIISYTKIIPLVDKNGKS